MERSLPKPKQRGQLPDDEAQGPSASILPNSAAPPTVSAVSKLAVPGPATSIPSRDIKIPILPPLPLQNRAEYVYWKQKVEAIAANTKVGVDWLDYSSKYKTLNKWLLDQLPEYLSEAISTKLPHLDLPWAALDRCIEQCLVCGYDKTKADVPGHPWVITPGKLNYARASAEHGCEKCYLLLDVMPAFFSSIKCQNSLCKTPLSLEEGSGHSSAALARIEKTPAQAVLQETEEWSISMKTSM